MKKIISFILFTMGSLITLAQASHTPDLYDTLRSVVESPVPVSDLKDWHSDVVKAYMVPHVPLNYLIDPEGKIIAVELRGDALGQALEKILK